MSTAGATEEAEASALGCVFIKPDAASALISALSSEDFSLPFHREAYAAMAELYRDGRPIDPVLVYSQLEKRGWKGSNEGVMQLVSAVPTAENLEHYLSIVKTASLSRNIAYSCAAAIDSLGKSVPPTDVAVQLSSALTRMATRGQGGAVLAGELVYPLLDEISNRAKAKDGVIGLSTGVRELDRVLGGLRPGNMVLIAADTGGGKTALAMQIAQECVIAGGTALALNMEMTRSELLERAIVRLAGVNSQSVRNGTLGHEQFISFQRHAVASIAHRLFIDDRASTILSVEASARDWRIRNPDGNGLLVVDYVQLIRGSGNRNDSRAREIGEASQRTKALARELGVPAILVSQFNRGAAMAGRAPSKSDLKESSSLEQDSDQIILIHNPASTEDGTVDLIVDKNRHGPRRTVPAKWVGRYYRFQGADDI